MNMVFPQDYQRISYDSFEEAQQSSGQVHPSVKQVTIKLQSLQPVCNVYERMYKYDVVYRIRMYYKLLLSASIPSRRIFRVVCSILILLRI